ncbi:MAG: transporter substrate-binding domain-containing protein [candidate division NC10 bacterium]|nr:transporter substrate-binding domain-containing protein [candidate division NC10 bacterium]
MRIFATLIVLTLLVAGGLASAGEPGIAPTGTLRAAYISSNLAQAVKDPTTGEYRGVSTDIAMELGRRNQVPVTILPLASAAAVLEAVQKGRADIGFVAPNPERMGIVLYSQIYMLVQQSFLVRDNSPIASVSDIDRPGRKIGANTGDSIAVYLKTWLKHATLVVSPDYTLKEASLWLADGKVDAFGGNRQRLRVSTQGIPGLRLLPDSLYGVPQAIAVANEKPELLAAVNQAIDELRSSGFLRDAVQRSGVDGIDVAPAVK